MKPAREHTTNNAQTYFITSETWECRALFNVESWARLFFKTLLWQRGFADHRIRDIEDYDKHFHSIHLSPVKKHLCASPAEYRYSSAYPGWKLDPIPQGLKPQKLSGPVYGTAKAVPLQDNSVKPAAVGDDDELSAKLKHHNSFPKSHSLSKEVEQTYAT